MSESIKALKALRDAAQEQQDFQRDKTGDTATQLYYGAAQLVSCCDRAIAALEAAEQPKACAGFVCEYGHDDDYIGCGCPCRCGKSRDAHQQPRAEQAQQPARKYCEHCSGVIAEDEDFTVTADDYWLHAKCAVERPAHPQPCPDGDACPDARRWGNVHQQPAPADVPPMPPRHTKLAYAPDELLCHERDVAALHAACVRIARERDEARAYGKFWEDECGRERGRNVDLESERDEARRELEAEREKREQAEAELAALKAQEPQTPLQLAAAACRAVGMLEGHSDQIAESVRILAVRMKDYADTHIPLAQHEAALAQSRREGLREAEALVRRDARRMLTGPVARNALIVAADAIRALAEEIK